MDRKTAYTALFARLQGKVPTVKSFTRRAFSYDQMPVQPALEVYPTQQVALQDQGHPTTWHLQAEVVIYTRVPSDPTVSPDDELLDIISQVETALAVQPGEAGGGQFTTLGGACRRCWISGPVMFVAGTATDQAIAVIPVEMLLA